MKPLHALAGLSLVIAACAPVPDVPGRAVDPLRYDPVEVDRAEKLAIFVPGVLTSVEIFESARTWEQHGYALAFYRFPGLDGLPADRKLKISEAAGHIAAFVNQTPSREVALVGFSAGAPIALLAASKISPGRAVKVAAISPAVEHGGGLPTAARGAVDLIAAAARAQTADLETIWRRYWQTLLFGRDGLQNPALQQDIATLTASERDRLVIPTADLRRAHTGDLRNWEIPPDLDLGAIDIGMFVGLSDPVFSTRQTLDFRNEIGHGTIFGYPSQGHLLFLTVPDLFDDILAFLEGKPF